MRPASSPRSAEAKQPVGVQPLPNTTLVYGALLVDPVRTVWAYRAGEGSRDWDVYGPSGACLGTVRMPAGLTALEIGEDYVLGRSEDRADVERVQLHKLSRR